MIVNNRYKLIRELGRGRSKVFLCADTFYNSKNIALKILPATASDEEERSFRNEYFTQRQFSHPNIAEVFEYGKVFEVQGIDEEIPICASYIASEYFDGIFFDSGPKLSEEELSSCIVQICFALQHIHQSNYIYYDLKPENILLDRKNGRIKLIDFGLTEAVDFNSDPVKKGSVEYISPEIISGEIVDHRTDFYSLGIILYKIIFGKLPFNSVSELAIYKEKLLGNFDFPVTHYSDNIVALVRKLLSRKPSDRFFTAMDIAGKLECGKIKDAAGNKLAENFFVGKAYSKLTEKLKSGVFTSLIVKGIPGSGKSALLKYFEREFNTAVRLSPDDIPEDTNPLELLIYSMQKSSGQNIRNLAKEFDADFNLMSEYFRTLNFSSRTDEFIFIIDSLSGFDDYTKELISQTATFCQINNIRIVISINSDSVVPEYLKHFELFSIWPLNKSEIKSYFEQKLAYFLPRDNIIESAIAYSGYSPGALHSFTNKLFANNIVKVFANPPAFVENPIILRRIKDEHEAVFQDLQSFLSKDEILAVQYLASFQIEPTEKVFTELIGNEFGDPQKVFDSLKQKGWLRVDQLSRRVKFVNPAAKTAIYNASGTNDSHHAKIAERISAEKMKLPFSEVFFQNEKAGKYENCYELLMRHIEQPEFSTAYSYQKMIVSRMLELPVKSEFRIELILRLAQIQLNIGEYSETLKLLVGLEKKCNSKTNLRLIRIKGEALIGSGELKSGFKLLEKILNEHSDRQKLQIQIVMAGALLDLEKYPDAIELCAEIEQSKFAGNLERGKCRNLIALISILQNGDYESSKEHFMQAEDLFAKGKHYDDQASVLINLGNIASIEGAKEEAGEYWARALKLINISGNIEKETKVLMNKGILEFESCEFENAAEHFLRANNIFLALGNKFGQGLSCSNLGELYTITCEYSKAFEYLDKAASIFAYVKNPAEQAVVLLNKIKLYDNLNFYEERDAIIDELAVRFKNIDLPDEILGAFRFWSGRNSNDNGNSEERFTYYLRGDNKFQAADILTRYLSEIHVRGKINLLGELLRNSDVEEKLELNPYFKAWKAYFDSSYFHEIGNSDDAFIRLEEAYQLLSEISITELTWNVLFRFVIFFKKRGDINRAAQYLSIANDVMNLIIKDLTKIEMEDKYLNVSKRKKCIDELKEIELEIYQEVD